ncbi:uncharacterized protein LOC111066778 [Drosophila obscura]|uniref:uncharacterized protein LOC111066778 n=1 Tax=Drosophila obscura TaxID=7282 RepID=UPI001BB26B30|nr:uncharacterized protein LOC111066778 [Drosophila obscura]
MFKLKTLRGEETGLESGLQVCKKLEDDLVECLNVVDRLSRKYKDPVEDPVPVNSLGSPSTLETSSCSDLSGNSLLRQDPEVEAISTPVGARSGQQLSSSYVDMHTKCIKIKRELEGTISLNKQISELAYRQRKNDYSIPEEITVYLENMKKKSSKQ